MSPVLFETVLGNHCSPVLMGLKPSNLISLSKEKCPKAPEYAVYYTEKLKKEGIRMELICSCKKHYLLLVYRPQMLKACLSQKEARIILEKAGYPRNGNLDEMIAYLKKRYAEKKEFPHEIGIFLGYPLEDVKGFQKYGGDGCKMCGYWKVYGDVEKAKIIFAQFDRCREFIINQLQKGYPIEKVVGMKNDCAA